MASVPAAGGPDSPVTVKVTFQGITRRAKMPLRVMAPDSLEKSVRAFLNISDESVIFIERYSDSAAAYVMLQAENIAVYKQLFRAAKAKSKLKLRVSLKESEDKPATPQPVTVEDAPETPSLVDGADAQPASVSESAPPSPSPAPSASSTQTTLPLRSYEPPSPIASNPVPQGDRLQALEGQLRSLVERNVGMTANLDDSLRLIMDRNTGMASHLAQQQQQLRAMLRTKCCSVDTAVATPEPAQPSTPESPAVTSPTTVCGVAGPGFAVCCNSCECPMPDAHYHCSTCDDGDFDLCPPCVEKGITCYSNEHWLIKRNITDGHIVASTTEKVAPKLRKQHQKKEEFKQEATPVTKLEAVLNPAIQPWAILNNMRTCNCCIKELPEKEFLHCDSCPDYDLCIRCFGDNNHGHHPKHSFSPAVAGTNMPSYIKSKMAPGRNQMHYAICDGCDKYIGGVRHKCLDCPDWDYCSTCIKSTSVTHPKHRFVPIYEPLTDIQTIAAAQPVHVGICCDGPLCSVGKATPSYIRGVRYKCAVCHDLDFCANCEASPANEHNRTHPLIKFRTPVRHVSVTTTGERQDGKRLPTMGDRRAASPKIPTAPKSQPIQTVVDVKPAEPIPAPEPVKAEPKPVEVKPEVKEEKPVVKEVPEYRASYVRETVADGTIFPPNHVFEQTWYVRNTGKVAWPAGCSVKFVGGDYMGHVDSAHPAGIAELVSASESTVCYAPLAPGQEFPFTVLLRTPSRMGKIVSYWRLTSPTGEKFGHRLWCDVSVRNVSPGPKAVPVPSPQVASPAPEVPEPAPERSTMIFPKLETESPVSSVHQESAPAKSETTKSVTSDEFEECEDDAEWDVSDGGFMTDEEYDILDASDDEYLEQQNNKK